MTPKEAIAKAAQLFAEWVEGDEFEYEGTTPGKYYGCPATDVVRWLFGDVAVRIKPRPKKVLRPPWEILRDETVIRIDVDGRIFLREINFADVIEAPRGGGPTVTSTWPPEWFTTEEPKR